MLIQSADRSVSSRICMTIGNICPDRPIQGLKMNPSVVNSPPCPGQASKLHVEPLDSVSVLPGPPIRYTRSCASGKLLEGIQSISARLSVSRFNKQGGAPSQPCIRRATKVPLPPQGWTGVTANIPFVSGHSMDSTERWVSTHCLDRPTHWLDRSMNCLNSTNCLNWNIVAEQEARSAASYLSW